MGERIEKSYLTSASKRTKARNNKVYARTLCWAVLKRDGKTIWGKMSIVIPHYVIGVYERSCASIRKITLLFVKLFEENAEAWIGETNICHLLQFIIIGENDKALIVKWLYTLSLISETASCISLECSLMFQIHGYLSLVTHIYLPERCNMEKWGLYLGKDI